jgi:hypothetical protein
MAQSPPRPRSRNAATEGELWFSMASSARTEVEPELSLYEAASRRHAATRSISPSRFSQIPVISTSEALNKPLPPSPGSEKKRRTPASLRNLIRRRPSGEQDSTHLQPEPYQQHHRSSSASNDKLSPDPYQYNTRQSSRSMPSSPLEYTSTQQPYDPSYPSAIARSHSAAANYSDMPQYQAYSPAPQPSRESRSVSMASSFESPPLRASSTFPDPTYTATPRGSVSTRPRPYTSFVSPTEPFQDPSEVGLFAAATCGLPGGFDPFSPTESPHLQSSLFARERQNDIIPLLPQSSLQQQTGGFQPLPGEYIPRQRGSSEVMFSSSALPSPPQPSSPRNLNMNAINMELERLGLADQEHEDDELPNYAQSQAQMSELKRKEASARARELEARWNSSRGSWRSR